AGDEPPISIIAPAAGSEKQSLRIDAENQGERATLPTTTSSNRFLQIAADGPAPRRRIFYHPIFHPLSSATRTASWFASDADSSIARRRRLECSLRRFPSRFIPMIQRVLSGIRLDC